MLREIGLTVAILFLTSGVPTNAQKSATGAAQEAQVAVAVGAPLTVECLLRVEQRAEWRLNGSAVPADMRPAGEAAAGEGRLAARLHAAAARAHHAGLYSCSREPGAPRVRVRLLPAAAAAAGADEDADSQPLFTEVNAQVLYYDINRNITLRCPLTNADKALVYAWTKNEKSLEETAQLKDRYVLEEGGAQFRLKGKAAEEDYGNYTCALGGELHAWDVRGRPVARLPDNTNVVENQNIKLQCKVLGKPWARVWWTYNSSLESNDSEALTEGARGGRVALLASEQGVAGAALELRAAERGDAGVYTCHAGGAADSTTLRVKDMYAALWPFLGICAEVFVLCAIILVYEKRRTKPELDDSDTDNHDQKKS